MFYIELPADKHGNTALPLAVFEGTIVQGGTPGAHARHFSNPARQALLISAPADVAARHVGMYTDAYGGFAEVSGPARMLSRHEYDAIVEALPGSDQSEVQED